MKYIDYMTTIIIVLFMGKLTNYFHNIDFITSTNYYFLAFVYLEILTIKERLNNDK